MGDELLGTSTWIWAGFFLLLLALLTFDIRVFHKKAHRVEAREALMESAGWIGAALIFNLALYFWRGPHAGVEFLTGYLIEKSLSVDNIFVILVIFQVFRIPAEFQHRVLYYGILGALVMRGVFVTAGVKLLETFQPALYVFGAILLLTGIRMILPHAKPSQMEKGWMVRLAGKVLPAMHEFDGQNFWVRREGKWLATPLFLALVTVETMDILFAIDSVPAVLAITRDAFIAFSSNAFAILGLRAMFFALADLLPRFRFLHQGLALLLMFVGLKMTFHNQLDIPDLASLATVGMILALTIGASLLWPGRKAGRMDLQT